jgi:tetratricopeptide (TPR) repeat protein
VLQGQLLATVRDFARKREATAGARPAAVSEGFSVDLSACPVAELLGRLHREGASGTCVVMRGEEQRGIQLRNGSPVAVSSNRRAEAFEEYLTRSGWLTQKQHDELLAQLNFGMGSVEEILVGLGALSEAEIAAAERERTEEQLFGAFGWESGSARFLPGKRLKAGTAIEIEVAPAELLLRGALRAATPAQIREALEQRRSLYASALIAGAPALTDSEPEAEELLAGLDGDRTVAELLEADEANARLLYALWISGLAELCTEAVLVLEDTVGGAEPEPAATDTEATAAQDAKQATERSLEAENWFRKGRLCLREKAHAKAVEAFGMASHLDPGEGDYVAHLGYSLYMSNPNQTVVRREAMEHIAKGIKLSPEREMPYVYLARIFRETDDVESARKVLRRAAKIHPDSLEVQRERRLLGAPSPQKAGGFFARFKRR